MDWETYSHFLSGEWTFRDVVEVLKFLGVVAGILVSALTLVRWWYSFERNKVRLLERYLESKLEDVAQRREIILDRIRNAPAEAHDDVEFNFNAEIEAAVRHLDNGKHENACSVLRDMLKRVDNKIRVEERRLLLLQRQKASVALFLAAISEARNLPDEGLPFVSKALHIDRRDKEALKYQGLLLLLKGLPARAVNSFNRLRQLSPGANNVRSRAEAHQLLGLAYLKQTPPDYVNARANSATAANIIGRTPDDDRDYLILGRAFRQLGEVWDSTNEVPEQEAAENSIGRATQHSLP